MKAEYAIGTLDILAGKMPRRANALILEWASKNRTELMNNWHKAIIPEAMNPIEPLK